MFGLEWVKGEVVGDEVRDLRGRLEYLKNCFENFYFKLKKIGSYMSDIIRRMILKRIFLVVMFGMGWEEN